MQFFKLLFVLFFVTVAKAEQCPKHLVMQCNEDVFEIKNHGKGRFTLSMNQEKQEFVAYTHIDEEGSFFRTKTIISECKNSSYKLTILPVEKSESSLIENTAFITYYYGKNPNYTIEVDKNAKLEILDTIECKVLSNK